MEVVVFYSYIGFVVAVMRSEVGEQTFRLPGITIIVEPFAFGLLPAAAATLAMALMLAATAAWSLLARSEGSASD